MHTVIYKCCALLHVEMKDDQWDTFIQFVKFAVVGVSNFAISYVVYAVFIGLKFNWIIASVAGFVISVLNSFYWNDKYVFKKEEGQQRMKFIALGKTFMSYAFSGLILANVLLFLWNEALHINPLLGPIINLFITTPINYFMNKIWAFKVKLDNQDE